MKTIERRVRRRISNRRADWQVQGAIWLVAIYELCMLRGILSTLSHLSFVFH